MKSSFTSTEGTEHAPVCRLPGATKFISLTSPAVGRRPFHVENDWFYLTYNLWAWNRLYNEHVWEMLPGKALGSLVGQTAHAQTILRFVMTTRSLLLASFTWCRHCNHISHI